jgi:NAD(P)-dependent dehydrogenase (short-subunit alcohol dehydrogenase family)
VGRFAGLSVWITGGGTGLGRYMALEFGRQGAHVAVSGRRESRLIEVVEALQSEGGVGMAVPCDVSDDDAIRAAIGQVVDEFGALDVAVANAGYAVGGFVEDLDREAWRRQLEINVVSAAMTARFAIPELRKTGGRLGLVGSVSSALYMPSNGAYQASKAAILALGATLSAELEPEGMSCTTLHPGFVVSEIGQVDNTGQHHPERVDRRPAQLMWQTEDAARVMVQALYKRRRQYTFTGHGRFATALARYAPWLVHQAGLRMARTELDKRAKKRDLG